MRCLIFANGEIKNYNRYRKYIKGDEYIICADGGARHVRKLQLVPQLIIGDMDSVPLELLQEFRALGCVIKQFPTEKDEVDTELALNEAMKLNPREILVMGAVGSRLDHTLANIQLLIRPVMKGINTCLIGNRHIVSLITPSLPGIIEGEQGDLLSLLPLTPEVRGVKTRGLKWNLQDNTFKFGHPYGISNVLLEDNAAIKIKEGIMVLIRVLEEV
ncbi:thiamine diphosphokinase [Desulfolucanica intricata]|uniref:thiamine diphosphokinase n=1 Tax=Desulfolucanica intricata TaxID=1285191 RepID=UPI00082D9D40|nr:thiamine diphosphokinase [Desulfolucanica intricata]